MCRLFERIQYNYIWWVIMVGYTTCFNRGLENLKSVCDRSISWPPDAMRTMCRSTWRFVAPRGLTALQVLAETMRRPWHGDAIRMHRMYMPDMCLTMLGIVMPYDALLWMPHEATGSFPTSWAQRRTPFFPPNITGQKSASGLIRIACLSDLTGMMLSRGS